MDFGKTIIMILFMNFIMVTTMTLISNNIDTQLTNNGLTQLAGNQDIYSLEVEETGWVSTLYEATIGNGIAMGKQFFQYVGLATFDTGEVTAYQLAQSQYPVTTFILNTITVFGLLINLYLGVSIYRFVKNKGA